jgi:hypothetical protein
MKTESLYHYVLESPAEELAPSEFVKKEVANIMKQSAAYSRLPHCNEGSCRRTLVSLCVILRRSCDVVWPQYFGDVVMFSSTASFRECLNLLSTSVEHRYILKPGLEPFRAKVPGFTYVCTN